MENNHVILALRRKRAELAGLIPEAERRLESLREAVASIDVTLRLFDPNCIPENIRPKRPYKRRSGFACRELPRLVADEIRKASTPLSAHAIAVLIATGKGSDEAITKQVVATLNALQRRERRDGMATRAVNLASSSCTEDASEAGEDRDCGEGAQGVCKINCSLDT